MGHYGNTRVDNGAIGAFFRKISSNWKVGNLGLLGEGRLPAVALDAARYFIDGVGFCSAAKVADTAVVWSALDSFRTGPLDRPSVYMGGLGTNEMDSGLTWDRVYDSSKRPTYTSEPSGNDGNDPLKRFVRTASGWFDGNGQQVAGAAQLNEFGRTLLPNFAFRPFWRNINGHENAWHNPVVGTDENIYLYPEEEFHMSVSVVGNGKIVMKIGSLSEPEKKLEVPMVQSGFASNLGASFKRVNSIDVKSNEGRPVPKTQSKVTGASWSKVSVVTAAGGRPLLGPGSEVVKGADTAPNYDKIFAVTGLTDVGGETLTIDP